jgi:hypothetical protein
MTTCLLNKLYVITEPDLNIDTEENGTMPVIDREAWERFSDETSETEFAVSGTRGGSTGEENER